MVFVFQTKGSPFVSRLKKEGTTSASTKSPSKDKTGEGSSKGKPATATPEPNKKGNGKLSSSGNGQLQDITKVIFLSPGQERM